MEKWVSEKVDSSSANIISVWRIWRKVSHPNGGYHTEDAIEFKIYANGGLMINSMDRDMIGLVYLYPEQTKLLRKIIRE
jgi:hypothetical protein